MYGLTHTKQLLNLLYIHKCLTAKILLDNKNAIDTIHFVKDFFLHSELYVKDIHIS